MSGSFFAPSRSRHGPPRQASARHGFAASAPGQSPSHDPPAAYLPGRCNIGSAEIARRRAFGHLGFVTTVALFVTLLAIDAPREWRLLLFFPAGGAAVGYLQAWLRFCVAFGLLGVFNFGRLGEARRVTHRAALARDRRRALALVAASAVVGATVAVAAFVL